MHLPLATRRKVIAGLALLPAAPAAAYSPGRVAGSGNFTYEVDRTDEEWRALLTDEEYRVMRDGGTEKPKSSPFWNSTEAGMYSCKGCDLPLYDSFWKVELDKGWVFFIHSEENAVLTGIDGTPDLNRGILGKFATFVEVHCRRCGSHLGHILNVDSFQVHCINGASLKFTPAEA
ncbi:MAG: peptide-methionine (R)-S-oxide reductase [Pseudomonadota bacterium]